MDTIYVVDAINYLFRAYYAIGPMSNGKGQATGALFGFIRSVQKLRKDFSIEYLAIVFDGPDNKKSRRAVYAEYKSHRKEVPEDLLSQFALALQWCALAGIPTLCIEGVEADDTIATIALWAKKHSLKTVICSSDKDLMQLVDERTHMLHVHKDNLRVDSAKVQELFGIRPDQVLDYLALAGDASDNIPGVPGFGPKTAVELLREFETLDRLLEHLDAVKGEKKRERLRAHKKEALMSRELAALNTNVEIPQQKKYYCIQPPDLAQLNAFYHEMKFLSLLHEKPPVPARGKNAASFLLIDGKQDLQKLLEQLSSAKEAALYVNAIASSPMESELLGIAVATTPDEAFYIPCQDQTETQYALKALRSFFANTPCAFYSHDGKKIQHILSNAGCEPQKISFDTMLASYLLAPQSKDHDLDRLMAEKLHPPKIDIQTLLGQGKRQVSLKNAPLDPLVLYHCERAAALVKLKELFLNELNHRHLKPILYEMELPLLSVLANMERYGIYLDAEALSVQKHELLHALTVVKKKIFHMAGKEFNLNSPMQLSAILFETLKIKKPFSKKTTVSTGAEVLEAIAAQHPIAHDILEYRALEKLRSTYVEALPLFINAATGRIHCTFNQSVAATGRLSCQDPNLQNIPVRSEGGLKVRACFKPQKRGWSFIGADYSQIELRILAHFSEDPELLRAFRTKQDIHAHTASLVYDIHPAMVTPEMRSIAKTVNFGILYGQGPLSLSKQLGIPLKEASEFIKTYFERYPHIQRYLESCKKAARETGVATTLTGRQRPIPDMHSHNPALRAAAERLAINTPLQGTAADLIKIAMIEIDASILKKNLKGRMVLQIHDELIFEAPDDEVETLQHLAREKMETILKLNVPIEVHLAVGKNWAEC